MHPSKEQELPSLHLYNTETRDKRRVIPSLGDTILLYTCGPTVYNFAHIGNFRTYVFEDLLRRSLQFFGMKVRQVMNLTDVDDKTIKGAIDHDLSLADYTAPYILAFFEDLDTLGIQRAEEYPAATDYIPDMIKIIERLIDKGVAYVGFDKSVYFRISSFPSYGRLSHLDCCGLLAGAGGRVGTDEYGKDELSDFVLWKAYDPLRDGSIYWDSPFGLGRPGWHIECSAMAMKILGESIDIHVGGVDNMFPHHENEIAQSEAFSGKVFVHHWLHAEHLLVNHKKMSKSLGNFYTVRDLLQKGYSGLQIRYALMQVHYRLQLNFTIEGLEAAGASAQRILDFVRRMRYLKGSEGKGLVAPLVQTCLQGFALALADDLNISSALSHLFDFLHEVHILCDREEVSRKEADSILEAMQSIDSVLGLLPLESQEQIPAFLEETLQKREQARKEKNWAVADACRDLLLEHGYRIEDSLEGPSLKKIKRGVDG